MIIPRALYITVCENELYCTVKKTEYTHCSFSQLLQLSQVHKKMVCMSISIVTGSDITLARTLLPSTSVVTWGGGEEVWGGGEGVSAGISSYQSTAGCPPQSPVAANAFSLQEKEGIHWHQPYLLAFLDCIWSSKLNILFQVEKVQIIDSQNRTHHRSPLSPNKQLCRQGYDIGNSRYTTHAQSAGLWHR